MSLLDSVPLNAVTEVHLASLVSNGTGEALDLEFKALPYGGSDDDKREFLKDNTALANTSGGHLIVGIEEKGGTAVALRAIASPDADAEKLRLESLLLACIEPRLVGVQIREVAVLGGYALVLRVPRSWNPPHRITFKGLNRYYLRHSGGVYEPSVDQLRAVFLGGADAERRLLDFRLDRLARLRVGDKGLKLHERGQLLVQAVPLAESSFVLPPQPEAMVEFAPPGTTSLTWRYNFEGLLVYSSADHGVGITTAYTQVFRDGRIEMARGGYARKNRAGEDDSPPIIIGRLVVDMLKSATRAVMGAARYGASLPIAVMVSLLDARGTRLPPSRHDFETGRTLDRSDLLFAPVVVESAAKRADIEHLFLPVLDALWNAYGEERCHDVVDASGAWSGPPKDWGGG